MPLRRRDSEVFGKVPAGATHWSVRRKGALSWEWCTYAEGDGLARQEFPIADLTLGVIRDRFGAGTYRLMYLSIGSGVRQVFGNGKIFELTESHAGGTPRPMSRVRDDEPPAGDVHGDMVRVLLKAGLGKQTPAEVYEALAVPMGMGLSALFTGQDRIHERFEALERRLTALEARLPAEPAPQPPPNEGRLDRLLDRLEAIEGHLVRTAPPRRNSPTGRRTPR